MEQGHFLPPNLYALYSGGSSMNSTRNLWESRQLFKTLATTSEACLHKSWRQFDPLFVKNSFVAFVFYFAKSQVHFTSFNLGILGKMISVPFLALGVIMGEYLAGYQCNVNRCAFSCKFLRPGVYYVTQSKR